jgi:hypothetical protein
MDPQTRTCMDAGRDLHLHLSSPKDPTLAVTLHAGIGDHLAFSAALRAWPTNAKETLPHLDLAVPATGGARLWRGAVLAAGRTAAIARHLPTHFDGSACPLCHLFERQPEFHGEIRAASPRTPTTTTTTEKAIE